MSRDRFNDIVRSLYFAETIDEDLSDEIWKWRPLTDKLKSNFVTKFDPEENLPYDESMNAYTDMRNMLTYGI